MEIAKKKPVCLTPEGRQLMYLVSNEAKIPLARAEKVSAVVDGCSTFSARCRVLADLDLRARSIRQLLVRAGYATVPWFRRAA